MLITFSRIVYPLSVFWLQIRIKKRTNFLPIDSKMTTSQLWFNLLPVVASLLTVIFSLTNSFLYILGKLINLKKINYYLLALEIPHKKHNVKKFVFYLYLFKFKTVINKIMKNISLKGNINFDKKKDINDYELFSLKITDSLYKKDIGKFLETLSSHFI